MKKSVMNWTGNAPLTGRGWLKPPKWRHYVMDDCDLKVYVARALTFCGSLGPREDSSDLTFL